MLSFYSNAGGIDYPLICDFPFLSFTLLYSLSLNWSSNAIIQELNQRATISMSNKRCRCPSSRQSCFVGPIQHISPGIQFKLRGELYTQESRQEGINTKQRVPFTIMVKDLLWTPRPFFASGRSNSTLFRPPPPVNCELFWCPLLSLLLNVNQWGIQSMWKTTNRLLGWNRYIMSYQLGTFDLILFKNPVWAKYSLHTCLQIVIDIN